MTTEFVSWEQAVSWLLEQPDQQELVRECYLDRPVIEAAKRYADSNEWHELTRHLPRPAGQALDLGAGNGIVSYALAKRGWHVRAVEPEASVFVGTGAIRKLAADENLPILVDEEYGESIPHPNEVFDLVMARQVMHHANNLGRMCNEIGRVLKPGGTLIAFRDHVISSERGLRRFRDNHPLHNLYGGENAYRLSEYRHAIRNAGLVIDKEYHQFDSVINYAPRSKDDIRRAIAAPLKVPALQRAGFKAVGPSFVFGPLMKMVTLLYRKPGRLVSFVCRKPLDKTIR